MSGCAAPTLKQVGGGRVENMYQEMVYYNRMHVKTTLSQSILSKIVVQKTVRLLSHKNKIWHYEVKCNKYTFSQPHFIVEFLARFFLKSMNLKLFTMSPKIHSTDTRIRCSSLCSILVVQELFLLL